LFDWTRVESEADIFRYFKNCIAFRQAHPVLRNRTHFRNEDYVGSGFADISWHGTDAWEVDWSYHSRTLAFMLDGQHARGGSDPDDYIYVAMNMHWESHPFELPNLPGKRQWHLFANTSLPSPNDIFTPGNEPLLEDQYAFLVGARSVVILVGR
jgi:glycogen operon protein